MSKRRSPKKQSINNKSLKFTIFAIILVIGLAGGLSYIPPSVMRELPPEVREMAEVATELRRWVEELMGLDTYEPIPAGALPRTPATWGTTRQVLYNQIYHDRRSTLYCGCSYNEQNQINLRSCGLGKLEGNMRAERVEAEHVFPASQFGNFRTCWRRPESFSECKTNDGGSLSGRDCCQRVDPTFVAAHNDMHNLFPSVGFINGRRSNYNWGMIDSGETYGSCEIRIDPEIRRAQPPEHTRGAIARTMLYMRTTYGFRLSRQDEQLYYAWNNMYPPDEWEIERNRRIRRIQGLGNSYIENYGRLP